MHLTIESESGSKAYQFSKSVNLEDAPKRLTIESHGFQSHIDCLRPDMTLCDIQTQHPQTLYFSYSKPVFRFCLQLNGTLHSGGNQHNALVRKPQQVELRYLNKNSGHTASRADESQHWIELLLQPSFFLAALPAETELLPNSIQEVLHKNSDGTPGVCQNLTPDQLMAIRQIHDNTFSGPIRTLYLKSKILEVMSLFFAEQTFSLYSTHSVSERDLGRVKKVRQLIVKSVSEAPTLNDIAREVGLSESKLKRDFKAVYSQSVFSFLRSYRMEHARELLYGQKGNISSVATAVGYTNVSHFSAAFTRHHGVKPSAYLKQIKTSSR